MQKVFVWLVALVTPVVLLLTAIRLLLTPVFVNIEYRMPGFPEDAYGMTQAQRLDYAPIALDYLLNDQGISFLGDQKFPDGSPMYNERELSHMYDVKSLTKKVLVVWEVLLALLLLGGLAAWRFGGWDSMKKGLMRGGQVTVVLFITALVFVALSFDALFVGFHHIFFQGDTWLFSYSDTLIRLFPLRFWQDVFIGAGGLTLLGAAGLWWGLGKKIKKK